MVCAVVLWPAAVALNHPCRAMATTAGERSESGKASTSCSLHRLHQPVLWCCTGTPHEGPVPVTDFHFAIARSEPEHQGLVDRRL